MPLVHCSKMYHVVYVWMCALQAKEFVLPREFLQLSASAAESRQRSESLYSSGVSSDPLPIRITVGDRQLSDSTSRARDNVAQQVNGNCDDLAMEQCNIARESSQTCSVRTGRGSAGGRNDSRLISVRADRGVVHVNDPEPISNGLDSVNGISGEVHVPADRSGSEPSLQTSPYSQLSDLLPAQNDDNRPSNDFTFVAAGHENAVTTQRKQQRRDDARNKCTQRQTYSSSQDAVAASSVERQSAANGRSTDAASVSARHRVETNTCSVAAVATPASNQSAAVQQPRVLNHSALDSIIDRHVSGHEQNHSSSADCAMVPATSLRQTECPQYDVIGQPTASGDSLQFGEYDVIPSSAECTVSAPSVVCDMTVLPPFSGQLPAVNQCNTVSPGHSDSSSNDLTADCAVRENLADCSDSIQPRNGIGRGQLLRMMLDNRQRLVNES